MNSVITQKPNVKTIIFAIVFFALFWVILHALFGTITAGFHLVDDHEIVHINDLLSKHTYKTIVKSLVKHDLKFRFRPFYFFYRVTIVKAFGDNFTLLRINNIIMTIIASFFFFLTLQQLKFSTIQSILFIILTYFGFQADITWRLGTAETIGLVTISVSLYFMVKNIYKHNPINIIIALFCIIITTLTKEAFIVILPAIIYFYVWLSSYIHKTPLIQSIKKNILFICILTIIMIIELILVTQKVGYTALGYAGIDASTFDIKNLTKAVIKLAWNGNAYVIAVFCIIYGLLIVVLQKTGKFFKKIKSEIIQKYVHFMILFGIFTIPQIILHSKSGFGGRYYIPGVLVFAGLIVILYKDIITLLKKLPRFQIQIFAIVWLILLGTISFKSYITIKESKRFKHEATAINAIFNKLNKESSQNDTICLVADPAIHYEYTFSTIKYLKYVLNLENIIIYPVYTQNQYDAFYQYLINSYKNENKDLIINNPESLNIKSYIVFPDTENAFYQKINKEKIDNMYNKETSYSFQLLF